jgi:hypothetical protein
MENTETIEGYEAVRLALPDQAGLPGAVVPCPARQPARRRAGPGQPELGHRAALAGVGQDDHRPAAPGPAVSAAHWRPAQAQARPGHRLPGAGDVPGDRL